MNDALFHVCLRKLSEWDLTKRERALATWIVKLSYGAGRKCVWVPRLDCLVDLTGFSRGDVSDALRKLQEKGALQISGPRSGGKRYVFLPAAELVEPERVVEPNRMAAALAAIEAANGDGEEMGGQLRLPHTVTTDESLSADLAKGSCERALSSFAVPSDTAELNRRIAESLGVPPPGESREGLANRLRDGVGETPTPSRASLQYTSTTSTKRATALQFTGTGETGDCGAGARKELLERIEKIVGAELWGKPRNFGGLWNTCLQAANGVAVTAAFEALGEYDLSRREKGMPEKPGAFLWGIFQRIQRQMLQREVAR